jgi:lysophospholipase L1-like esterase
MRYRFGFSELFLGVALSFGLAASPVDALTQGQKAAVLGGKPKAALTLPSGAIGVWWMDQYTATPSPTVPNAIATTPVSKNVLRLPRRAIGVSGDQWLTQEGFTLTYGQTASDGSPDGIRFVASASAQVKLVTVNNVPAGTYTQAMTCISNTGSSQTFNIGFDGTNINGTATTSWSRITATHSLSAGGYVLPMQWISGTLDVTCDDFEMYPGSSDLGRETLAGHLYLGRSAYSNFGTNGSGIVNPTSAGYGVIQFNASQGGLTAFTSMAMVNKITAGPNNQQDALTRLPTSFGDFGSVLDNNIVAYSGFYPTIMFGASNSIPLPSGSSAAQADQGFFKMQGAGWHVLTQKYDGTKADVFVDDVLIGTKTYSATTPQNVNDLQFNITQQTSNISGYEYNSMALWPSALTDAQIKSSVSVLQSRAAQSSIVATSVSRVYAAVGDSITAGFQATTGIGSYASISALAASPAVLGANWAVSGYKIADLVAQAPTVDRMLPANRTGRKFILSVLIGANDQAEGASAFTASLASYLDARRAAGWTVILCTLLPQTTAGFNPFRDAVNTNIYGWSIGQHYDYLADLAADPTIGIDGNGSSTGPWNTTYYNADGVHLNGAGHSIAAGIFGPVLNGI